MEPVVIAVVSLKGGTGKTTSALGLSTAATVRHRRTVLVDADPQFSAVAWAAAAGGLGFPVVRARKGELPGAVRRAVDQAQVVIVDTPPGETDLSLVETAAKRAHLTLVTVTPSGLDVARALDTLNLLERWGRTSAVLVTRTDVRTRVHRQLVGGLDEAKVPRLDAVIRQTVRLAEAFGELMVDPEVFGYLAAWDELEGALGLTTEGKT